MPWEVSRAYCATDIARNGNLEKSTATGCGGWGSNFMFAIWALYGVALFDQLHADSLGYSHVSIKVHAKLSRK